MSSVQQYYSHTTGGGRGFQDCLHYFARRSTVSLNGPGDEAEIFGMAGISPPALASLTINVYYPEHRPAGLSHPKYYKMQSMLHEKLHSRAFLRSPPAVFVSVFALHVRNDGARLQSGRNGIQVSLSPRR